MADGMISLETYKRMFSEARDLTQDARGSCLTDIKYYHGKQWSAEELQTLRSRKQPDTVHNWVRISVNGSLGVLEQGQTDPRAYGRNPNDDDAAEVVTKTLRYIADLNDFDSLKIDAARDYLVPGTCAVEITVDEKRRPKVEQIRWEEFFFDPRSRRSDFLDARYLGIAKWMYADDVAAAHPNMKKQIEDSLEGSAPIVIDETFQDRPSDTRSQWVDQRRRRVLVVYMYHREGGHWMRCKFFSGGILEKTVSPFNDVEGKPSCAIVAQSCYVDEENSRYGIVRDMRSPQDGINKRNSKLLHLLNNRQMRATDKAYEGDADTIRKEAARPDGVLPFGWDVVSTQDMAAGQFQLLANDTGLMERLGPSPSILGRQEASASGRAQLVRQQAGLTEQAVVFGGIEAWELRCYRAMWARAKQYWTAPDYIRITDDTGAPQYLGINQPQVQEVPAIVPHPMTGQPVAGVQRVVLGYENALAEMDVDITIDSVPDTANLAQEQFLALVDLAGKGVPIPPEMLIECSSLPKKRDIIEKMQEMAQQPNPQQEAAMAQAKANVEKTQSETMKNVATAEQTQVETHLNAFRTGHEIGSAGAADPEGRTAANA